ncbi:MAG: molybdopterin molybdotransferase MoeA [Candidatus Hydrogenedentes bacterium]|nr:molybdopterin molybdotransferase MoeA [Candidatus Hydrogenedentota bacterium]
MIRLQHAWEILAREITPLETHHVPLARAQAAYLGESVLASEDIPRFDCAAMDGYALRHADVTGTDTRLIVAGEIFAGSKEMPHTHPGHCHRIFTGANLPLDADTVVPVEQTSTRSFSDGAGCAEVCILELPEKGAYIYRRGGNARSGSTLLAKGSRVGSRQIGLIATTGRATVCVYRRPRIRILNTGAELTDVNAPADSHQIYNSTGPMLAAALAESGFHEVACETVPDNVDATIESIAAACAVSDVVIVTGGISAGLYDYVPKAIQGLGGEIIYHGIAMKPGKPQLFARSPYGIPIFGLPGNPLSSVVGFYELVLPAIRRLSGCPIETCRPELVLPLTNEMRNDSERLMVVPAQIAHKPNGSYVSPRPPTGSADLVTSATVDGAILLDPNLGQVQAGTPVAFRPWGGLFS